MNVLFGKGDDMHQETAARPQRCRGKTARNSATRSRAFLQVQRFAKFDAENDPHGEHDFGSFEVAGEKFFWKIDYYDERCELGSDDPADPEKTTRVLTIMLAEEY
jgi:hypothetical protein